MQIANTLPELIGNTPCFGWSGLPRAGVLAKLESFNPLSSAKDRAGLYMILDAEERGLLQPGAVIVEPPAATPAWPWPTSAASGGTGWCSPCRRP